MQRMFLGHPKHVPPGADSVSHLAKEAAVGRHHLYQGHSDLRERFEYLRDRSGQATVREVELQLILDRTKVELARTRELQVRTREEVDNLRGATENFARIINVLQAELRQEQLKTDRLHRRLLRYKEDAVESSAVIKMPNRHAGASHRQAEIPWQDPGAL